MAFNAKKVYIILKHEIENMEAKLNHPVRYKGTVASAELLPLNPDIGDMYNIESKSIYGEAGMNVAWNGVVWDTMGAPIDMSLFLKKDSEIIKFLQTKTEDLESVNFDEISSMSDSDMIPINDGTGMKKGVLSKLSDFILNKISNKDFSKLQTKDKTIVGAINELDNNSSSLKEDLEISLLENDRLYEGTNLAEKFKNEIANYSDIWQWIKARIKAKNFTGIHVNDYIRWQTTDKKWIESRIAGINTYKRYGDQEVPDHIDFISKDLWPTPHVMQPVDYNNGVIPVENLSGDGSKTVFVLTNEMAGIASVTVGGTAVTSYTYDADTHTITFSEAPATGTNNIVVTGAGSKYPWLASDLYLYANSLRGHVPGGTNKTSPVKLADYRNDGIWSKLPDELKAVIVTKRILIPIRYSTSGILLNNNDWGWVNMGKLWIPSEVEVYGYSVWANNVYDKGGFVQYPIFNCNMRRIKGLGNGGGRYAWWTISVAANFTNNFCYVNTNGYANLNVASYAWVGLPVCFRVA